MPTHRNAGSDAPRFILCHKHATSARLRFLRFPHGMLAFTPLPEFATLKENAHGAHAVRPHPGAWTTHVCARLGVPPATLAPEQAYFEEAICGGIASPVLLAEFTDRDPPFALADSLQGQFVTLTEIHDIPAIEFELLRRAYVTLME